jgi:hypothetical protein
VILRGATPMHLAPAQRRINGMTLPACLGPCLATVFHGWSLDLPTGIIDQSVVGVIPWRTGYEAMRLVIAVTVSRWVPASPSAPVPAPR